jgi:GNAT superfamily N-acetyltransferase
MKFRAATLADAPTLAELNRQLIRDEGHRNRMTLPELEERMARWLAGEYRAVLFLDGGRVVGYALFRFDPEFVYLRQFFVRPEDRRRGVGRAAIAWLRENAWRGAGRVRLDVLVGNHTGIAFWRAVGFRDYCLTLERPVGTDEDARQPVGIRRAVPDDASAIASVLQQAFAEFEAAYTPEAFAATTPTAHQIQDRFDEGPVWVAVDESVVVGTIAAVPQGEALDLRSMAVLPTGRGRGTGRRLLEEAEQFARQHGYKQLRLSTTPFLAGAIALYAGAGFSRSPEGPSDLCGTPLVTMVKRLSEPLVARPGLSEHPCSVARPGQGSG